MSNNDNYDEERKGLWFWIPLILILLVLFFIIRSCSNDDKLWQSSSSNSPSTELGNAATNALDKTLNSAKDAAKTTTGTLGDAVNSATNSVKDAANSATQAARNTASNASSAVGDMTDTTLNAAKQNAGNAVSNAGNAISDVASDAMSKAGNAANTAVTTTGNAINKIGNTAANATGKTIESSKSAATAAADFSNNSGRNLVNKMLSIPAGLLQGDIVNLLNTGKIVKGQIYNVGTIHFDSTQSSINNKDRSKLGGVAQIVKSYPSTVIHVNGYTDSSGSEDFNQTLSSKRAEQTKKWLIKAGAPATQIETHGHGSNNPVASNDTPEGRWKNRRTEIEIQQ